MSKLITATTLTEECRGSYEEISEEIRQVLKEHLGDVSILATFADRAVFCDGDTVANAHYHLDESGEIRLDDISKIDTIEHEDIDVAVAEELHSVVVDGLNGADIRKRLHGLSKVLKSDGVYWFSEAVDRIGFLWVSRPWLDYYEENTEDVRKGVHGMLGKLENMVPQSRYANLGTDQLSEHRAELADSFDKISSILLSIGDRLAHKTGDAMTESMKEDCTITPIVRTIAKLADGRSLKRLANVHDALAEHVAKMLVMEEFLHRREK